MMKRWISVAMAFSLFAAIPLCACGEKDDTYEDFEGNIPPYVENGDENLTEIPNEEPPKAPETPEAPEAPEVQIPETPEPPKAEEPKPEEPKVSEPEEPDKPTAAVPTKAQYVRVLVNGLNVRTGAGAGYVSLGQVEKGVLLDLKGKSGNWYETVFRGQRAFVSADESFTALSELDFAQEKIEAVISEGLKHMGVPYVYGATRYHDGKGNLLKGFTTSAFDCSSLMQYIFYKGAGVKLDVTTRTQILQGKSVSAKNIRRGDLLFFTNASRYYNTGIERVGHVALYLGDNYILHTASDYAKVEQISATRWSYFLEARRVI